MLLNMDTVAVTFILASVFAYCACASTPRLVDLKVTCDRSGHHVTVQFDKPFQGLIYANGFYRQTDCHFVKPSYPVATTHSFIIPVGRCGTTTGAQNEPNNVESTLIIQNDFNFQSATDSAHHIRCSWSDSYLKRVKAKPFRVVDPQVIPVTLVPSDSKRDSPWSSSQLAQVSRKADKAVTIYVQNATLHQDVTVLDCMAFEPTLKFATHLSDKDGCIIRPDLLSPFKKLRPVMENWKGIVLKSVLKESKMESHSNSEVNVKCNIILCEGRCPNYCTQ